MKITPETLTAYLDGELDEHQAKEVRERSLADAQLASELAELQIDRDRMSKDYLALGAGAPVDELRSALAMDAEPANDVKTGAGNRRLLVAAACAACLAIGVLVGSGSGNLTTADKSWREAVAEYQVLYSAETLKWNAIAPAEVDKTLEHLSGRIGVTLTRQALKVPIADFRRGQMLRFGSRPLVQLAYLHDGVTPVAFCITQDGAPDADLATEVREGLPIVHWARNGTSYMVIGDVPNEQLVGMAQALRGQL
ncbi:hypothetical protein [Anderseniella sp. Alg231-50]|uniref:hypothetical protein n=1 Tax=Anderseniella sp. Alg231-50 TaxID=1922226 RepID=UPI000D54C9E5